MDIEQLNKNQIVLLTLLVSFVTSIATGIATVSLMEKAPTDVTRVISRVIEQPIETIIPGEREVVTQTVVVQESDLIAQAIEEVRESIVRIYRVERTERVFVAFGIITDENGTVITNAGSISGREKYVATLSDGTQLAVSLGTASGSLLPLLLTAEQGASLPNLTPVAYASIADLKLGQTAVALGNSGSSLSVAPGILSEIVLPSSDPEKRGYVRTTVTSTNVVSGSPLLNTDGEIIGIAAQAETGLFRAVLSQSAATN